MHGLIPFARRAFQPIISSRLLLCQLLNLPKNFFMMKDAKMSVVCCAKILAQNSKWFTSYWGFSRGNNLCFTHVHCSFIHHTKFFILRPIVYKAFLLLGCIEFILSITLCISIYITIDDFLGVCLSFRKLLLGFLRYQAEIFCVDSYWPKDRFKLFCSKIREILVFQIFFCLIFLQIFSNLLNIIF